MPMVRVTEVTWARLVTLKRGMESMSDVIDICLDYREQYLEEKFREERARTSVEADRAKGG